MKFKDELLRDDYTFEQAELIQNRYYHLICSSKTSKRKFNGKLIRFVTGTDISYFFHENIEYGVAYAVNWNFKRNILEEIAYDMDVVKFPYRPGFLGFRECKLLAKAILKLHNKPDLVICDGHGKIHPRRFGEAVHLGYALNLPTIGVAKNPYIGYYNWNKIDKIKGNKTPIWEERSNYKNETNFKELLGYAVCLRNGSKPVFISEGYLIDLESAVNICLATTNKHRQPEPLYLADHLSREKVRVGTI